MLGDLSATSTCTAKQTPVKIRCTRPIEDGLLAGICSGECVYRVRIYTKSSDTFQMYLSPPSLSSHSLSFIFYLYSVWPSVSPGPVGLLWRPGEGQRRSEMWAEDCPIHHKLCDIVEQLDGLLLGFPAGCATSAWFIILSIPSAGWEGAAIKSSSTLSGGSKLWPRFSQNVKKKKSPRRRESLLLSAPLVCSRQT